MEREAMIADVMAAMDNKADMDTPWRVYAAAAVDALGWRTFEAEKPDDGDFILVTDGKARWIDKYFIGSHLPKFGQHIGTHWHPVHDLPQL